MLIKTLFNDPKDYKKSLKTRRAIAIALFAVGLVGAVCSFLLVPKSNLPDFAQGFYAGASAGILLGSLILFIRTQYLLSHPEQCKASQVKEQDEREVTITNRAFRLAGLITFFASAAALFVVLPLSRQAFSALLSAMALYSLSFFASHTYYSHKL